LFATEIHNAIIFLLNIKQRHKCVFLVYEGRRKDVFRYISRIEPINFSEEIIDITFCRTFLDIICNFFKVENATRRDSSNSKTCSRMFLQGSKDDNLKMFKSLSWGKYVLLENTYRERDLQRSSLSLNHVYL